MTTPPVPPSAPQTKPTVRRNDPMTRQRSKAEQRTCEQCGRVWAIRPNRPNRPNRHTKCIECRSPQCGTTGGYWRHHRQGEPPCDPCRAAHAWRVKANREGRIRATTTAPLWTDDDLQYRGHWQRTGSILTPTIRRQPE